MPTFGPGTAECLIFTYKDGLLSKVAHDLKLRVTQFEVEVAADRSKLTAQFDPNSLEVVAAMRDDREDVGALSASDRQKIQATIRDEVLETKRHGKIRLASRTITPTASGYRVEADLTLLAATRPLVMEARSEAGAHVAEVRIHQPDFGIKPFSAMLGTLRVKPDVLVRIRLPVA